MIKRIELIDFESHKHTVIDDFSNGLNLLVGDSNSGKSSLLRAIKLAAYNMYDPGCVRIGATKCVVRVDTDKGYVRVVRGPKVNEWEVCKNGEQPVKFQKVGKNIVPLAAEVMGLKLVTLGDVEFPVNVMSQLESHFMLSGVGDKNATGSMRAQIVDEISGLSGFEPLVKEVAADGIRFAREKNEIDAKVTEVEGKLIADEVLEKEEFEISNAERELESYSKLTTLNGEIENFNTRFNSVSARLDTSKQSLGKLPEVDGLLTMLERCRVNVEAAAGMVVLSAKLARLADDFSTANKAIEAFPDTSNVKPLVDRSEHLLRNGERIVVIYNAVESANSNIVTNRQKLTELPQTEKIVSELADDERKFETCRQMVEFSHRHEVCVNRLHKLKSIELPDSNECLKRVVAVEKHLDALEKLRQFADRVGTLANCLNGLNVDLKNHDEKLNEAENEVTELTKNVKVCPLTLKPIGPHCLG